MQSKIFLLSSLVGIIQTVSAQWCVPFTTTEMFSATPQSYSSDGTGVSWAEMYVKRCKEGPMCTTGTCMKWFDFSFTLKTADIVNNAVAMTSTKTLTCGVNSKGVKLTRCPGQLANRLFYMKQAGYVMVEFINLGNAATFKTFALNAAKSKLVPIGNPGANDFVSAAPSPSGKYIAAMYRSQWVSNLTPKDLQATVTIKVFNFCDLSLFASTTVNDFIISFPDFSWIDDANIASFEFIDFPDNSGITSLKRLNIKLLTNSLAVTSAYGDKYAKTYWSTTSGPLSRAGESLRAMKVSGSDPNCVASPSCQDASDLSVGTAYKIMMMPATPDIASNCFGGKVVSPRTSNSFPTGAPTCTYASFLEEVISPLDALDAPTTENEGDGNKTTTIVAASVGSVAGIAVIVGAVLVAQRLRKARGLQTRV